MGRTPQANIKELERYHKLRTAWFMANGPCRYCGSWDDLQVDHIDPSTKDPMASRSNIWNWSHERRKAELAKCQPLCRPCHQAKSVSERRVDCCKQGHEFTPENTLVYPSHPNSRNCKKCYEAYVVRRKAQRALASAKRKASA